MTPFMGRTIPAGHLDRLGLATAPAPVPAVDKWVVLKSLTTARRAFGLSDRTLTVLSALLSFLPVRELADGAPLIVFPSNRTLANRAHGMAESTLRRHLAALVEAGMILRHDSPNGKRYARRGRDGAAALAFGFDLRPLLVRAEEIFDAAEAARLEAEHCRLLREEIVLQLRDIQQLMTLLPDTQDHLAPRLAELRSHLRRRMDRSRLEDLQRATADLLTQITLLATPAPTTISGGNDNQNERHIQDSNHTLIESKTGMKNAGTIMGHGPRAPIGLPVVLKACPEIQTYYPEPIRHWEDLEATMDKMRPMLGITLDSWHEAKTTMGPQEAATALAGIVQKGAAISNPGGYLRALSTRTKAGTFTPGPMIMALLSAQDAARQSLPS